MSNAQATKTKLDIVHDCAQVVFAGTQHLSVSVRPMSSVDIDVRKGFAYSAGGMDVVRLGVRTCAVWN